MLKITDEDRRLFKLYWYMLSNNEEYRKDYIKTAGTFREALFTPKWGLFHPFNPFVSREPYDKEYTKDYNELKKNHSQEKEDAFCEKWDRGLYTTKETFR
jgi:hypothetical protein